MLLWLLACVEDAPDPVEVRLNEIVPVNTAAGGGLVDYEGDAAEWFELYNAADTPLDLEGFGLSNDPATPPTWTFEPGVVVPATDFLVVFTDGSPSFDDEIHSPVRIEPVGTLRLFAPDGTELDAAEWPAIRADWSWARTDEGWVEDATPTPLAPNED